MCLVDPQNCNCEGHVHPGVYHCAPCCDKPHVDEQFYSLDFGYLSLPLEVQKAIEDHAFDRQLEEAMERPLE